MPTHRSISIEIRSTRYINLVAAVGSIDMAHYIDTADIDAEISRIEEQLEGLNTRAASRGAVHESTPKQNCADGVIEILA